MGSQQKYLKPEVIQQVKRLDMRAKFIVEGFLSGLHSSPFHGFSAEFSEHRRYNAGDDLSSIDWNVYARTDRFYVKKFEAETNLSCYLMVDLSASMDYTYNQELTKLDYSICLAAALTYLMIHQSDAVGLITFDNKLRTCVAPRSRRTQLFDILAALTRVVPAERTDLAGALHQAVGMVRHRSLVVIFSDLLPPEDLEGDMDQEIDRVLKALHHLKHGNNDVILFHVLDAAEADFPFRGMTEFQGKETTRKLVLDADSVRADYLEALVEFRERYRRDCMRSGIDYIPLHTGMPFDKALMEYLLDRQQRF